MSRSPKHYLILSQSDQRLVRARRRTGLAAVSDETSGCGRWHGQFAGSEGPFGAGRAVIVDELDIVGAVRPRLGEGVECGEAWGIFSSPVNPAGADAYLDRREDLDLLRILFTKGPALWPMDLHEGFDLMPVFL